MNRWWKQALLVVLSSFLASAAGASRAPVRRVAILVYDGVELLDFAGPGEVFAAAGHGQAFEVFTVGETRAPVTSQGFVQITPQHAIADAPTPDVLVIPGGGVRAVIGRLLGPADAEDTARYMEYAWSGSKAGVEGSR